MGLIKEMKPEERIEVFGYLVGYVLDDVGRKVKAVCDVCYENIYELERINHLQVSVCSECVGMFKGKPF